MIADDDVVGDAGAAGAAPSAAGDTIAAARAARAAVARGDRPGARRALARVVSGEAWIATTAQLAAWVGVAEATIRDLGDRT